MLVSDQTLDDAMRHLEGHCHPQTIEIAEHFKTRAEFMTELCRTCNFKQYLELNAGKAIAQDAVKPAADYR